MEQAAAAAEALEEQAQHLAITVDGFKLDKRSLYKPSVHKEPASARKPAKVIKPEQASSGCGEW